MGKIKSLIFVLFFFVFTQISLKIIYGYGCYITISVEPSTEVKIGETVKISSSISCDSSVGEYMVAIFQGPISNNAAVEKCFGSPTTCTEITSKDIPGDYLYEVGVYNSQGLVTSKSITVKWYTTTTTTTTSTTTTTLPCKYYTCGECISDPNCGWCGLTVGSRCMEKSKSASCEGGWFEGTCYKPKKCAEGSELVDEISCPYQNRIICFVDGKCCCKKSTTTTTLQPTPSTCPSGTKAVSKRFCLVSTIGECVKEIDSESCCCLDCNYGIPIEKEKCSACISGSIVKYDGKEYCCCLQTTTTTLQPTPSTCPSGTQQITITDCESIAFTPGIGKCIKYTKDRKECCCLMCSSNERVMKIEECEKNSCRKIVGEYCCCSSPKVSTSLRDFISRVVEIFSFRRTTTTATKEYFTIKLSKGWNMISIPFSSYEIYLVKDANSLVYFYDSKDGNIRKITLSEATNKGFWIYSYSDSGILLIDGKEKLHTVQLYASPNKYDTPNQVAIPYGGIKIISQKGNCEITKFYYYNVTESTWYKWNATSKELLKFNKDKNRYDFVRIENDPYLPHGISVYLYVRNSCTLGIPSLQ